MCVFLYVQENNLFLTWQYFNYITGKKVPIYWAFICSITSYKITSFVWLRFSSHKLVLPYFLKKKYTVLSCPDVWVVRIRIDLKCGPFLTTKICKWLNSRSILRFKNGISIFYIYKWKKMHPRRPRCEKIYNTNVSIWRRILFAMGLFYYGLKYTTATYAVNFLNLVPIVTFVFCIIFRYFNIF